MHSVNFKATILVIDMRYEHADPDSKTITFKRLHMLAANKYGEVLGGKLLHTDLCDSVFADIVKLEAVPAEMLTFLDHNFEHGRPRTLVARSMHESLRYFEDSAPLVAARLQTATQFDVDTLIQMDASRSLAYIDPRRASMNANNTFAEFLNFQAIYEAKRTQPAR